MTTPKQRLALAICDFLTASAADGTLPPDEADSMEVAVNCITDSFQVDPTDKAAVAAAVGDQSLFKIYSVYEKLKGAKGPAAPAAAAAASSSSPSSSSAAASSSVPAPASDAAAAAAPTPAQKKEADGLKSKGNAAMAQKDYPAAISFYTQALALVPDNAIYLSNRAAAYSAAKDHAKARTDAEVAVRIDPTYTKAWSRLGLAKFAMGDAKGAMAAYQQGIDYEGNGGSDAMKKGYETAKRRAEELDNADALAAREGSSDDDNPTAGIGGGNPFAGFGGGGGGGMPDLGSIMSNPMFASMAQNLMSNPDMMSNLLSNPRLRDMANQFSGGGGGGGGGGGAGGAGGMPDLSSLMSDPSIAEIARNIMGGGAGGGAGGSGAGRGAGQ